MPGVNPSGRNLLLLLVLLFGQFILMSSSVQNSEGMSMLERGLFRVSHPVASVAEGMGAEARGFGARFHETRTAVSENRRLRREIQGLRQDLDRRREQASENERLRRLLEMRPALAPRSIAASVVTASLEGQARVLVLDKGLEDGVRVDQAVVAWGGAVGRVVFADRRFSKVRLLSDPNSGVAGLIQRSRVGGILIGRADGSLLMTYVSGYADVALGDRVITSGLDGVFPKGFGIGSVTRIRGRAGATKVIRVELEVDPAALEEALVLTDPLGGGLLDVGENAVGPAPPGGGSGDDAPAGRIP